MIIEEANFIIMSPEAMFPEGNVNSLYGLLVLPIPLGIDRDIADLFGADLPVHGGEKGEFAWRDGPLIQALKRGDWILLDELNLASQSVLEGLNACLDHRNEIFIPELGMTFHLDKYISHIFCCQNPQRQRGSCKGLLQSFLNRFTQGITKVYTKSGYMINSFTSKLPGGGRSVGGAPLHAYSLLDCVYSEEEKTFYILDVMCWNSHACFDSERDDNYNIGE